MGGRMYIRKSTPQDLARMLEIYAFARAFMAEQGNPSQWGALQWPPEALLRRDILEGNSYICAGADGRTLGTFYFRQGPDAEPGYREIKDGAWTWEGPYGVVHRLASDGSERGVGAFCLN